ncbi:AlpA family phage regulatory protein [Microbulbifer sp. OS29]|uniref:AlpA family phage regulatory protein n=1 Tax=Microbulbifer okhotskensis TaxID=2926617 RepID=A0A9X2ELM7_9GAMM|nr:AlpA family phage regulatory protein [Microbulbifer okhotskensis]MCO1334507.1 AlpA family phage regulatory protein [Microbulbifer okhotskensis]
MLRLREVERLTGYKSSNIYRMIKEEVFPQQRRIGLGTVGWDSREIDRRIEERLEGAAQ